MKPYRSFTQHKQLQRNQFQLMEESKDRGSILVNNFAQFTKRVRSWLDLYCSRQYQTTFLRKTQKLLVNKIHKKIVCPSNPALRCGGGLTGCIAKAGGADLVNYLKSFARKNGHPDRGMAVITNGAFGELKCHYLIHAIGPKSYGVVNEHIRGLLRNAVKESLELATKHKVRSIAIPAIASGEYEFPKLECVKTIFSEIIQYLKEKGELPIKEVRLVDIDEKTANLFVKELNKYDQ
eukprot:TRINITY_DN4122_c0_g1_i2.p1 TRINITY_DN4122_c0_g1~~TRINITY_DN4122_c0_g1_i2.p1  ORF type:complete len:255 (-),score=4.73 TRINITY_DN4122_c0_g1_i2:66-773(-)